jgi:hypothetical protein
MSLLMIVILLQWLFSSSLSFIILLFITMVALVFVVVTFSCLQGPTPLFVIVVALKFVVATLQSKIAFVAPFLLLWLPWSSLKLHFHVCKTLLSLLLGLPRFSLQLSCN